MSYNLNIDLANPLGLEVAVLRRNRYHHETIQYASSLRNRTLRCGICDD
jgi:hypothetical protein